MKTRSDFSLSSLRFNQGTATDLTRRARADALKGLVRRLRRKSCKPRRVHPAVGCHS